jgi:hypothetical protein
MSESGLIKVNNRTFRIYKGKFSHTNKEINLKNYDENEDEIVDCKVPEINYEIKSLENKNNLEEEEDSIEEEKEIKYVVNSKKEKYDVYIGR